jgi:23S rRNA G2069 N7-methylase RlmK/C1962 C5-methylase RlmI
MESNAQLHNLVENARALLAQGGTLESSSGSGPIPDDDLTKAVANTLGGATPPERPTDTSGGADAVVIAAADVVGRARST